MPEGPEIRRAATRLDTVLRAQTVEAVYFGQPALKRYVARLIDTRVLSVAARGKAILVNFSNNLSLYSHNQLYGRWFITRRGTLPKTTRTLRVGLHTQSHSALLYSASEIELLDPAAVAAHPYLKRLGPDALDETVVWRDIAARLRDPRFHRRALAGLYLDQSFVAGIGNYLRSEILHIAGLNPKLKPRDLSRREIGTLARATLTTTRLAYATAGVTNKPQRVRALKRQGIKRAAYRFAAFGRAGLPCYECATPIIRTTMASRRIYFCPNCQRGDPKPSA